MPLRSRPSGREAALLLITWLLAFGATRLEWAAVGAACANTAVTRGFAESTERISYGLIYLLALLVIGIGLWLPPRLATTVDVLALVAAVVAVALGIGEALVPFEARRPGTPAVGVLCTLDLAAGAWLAVLSLATFAAMVVVRLRAPGSATPLH